MLNSWGRGAGWGSYNDFNRHTQRKQCMSCIHLYFSFHFPAVSSWKQLYKELEIALKKDHTQYLIDFQDISPNSSHHSCA